MTLCPIILLLLTGTDKDVGVRQCQLVVGDTNNLDRNVVNTTPSSNDNLSTDTVTADMQQSFIREQMYNTVSYGEYDRAVALTFALDKITNDHSIAIVVRRLLNNNERNIVPFAYRLWMMGGTRIVTTHFPIQFKHILDGDYVMLKNEGDGLAVKLDAITDSDGDRPAWGDGSDSSAKKLPWKFIPVWENNKVYFKIFNGDRDQFLKLAISPDSTGDRRAYGSDGDDTNRHQWFLHVRQYYDELMFIIYNRQYDQPLKFGRLVDDAGNRMLWGHNGTVRDNPLQFAWRLRDSAE